MGVAHHSAYPIWFEIGRTELLRADGGRYRELEATGTFLVVVRLEVRYRQPARYDDQLDLTTTVDEVGHVKIAHSYRLCRDETILAVGSSVLACVDRSGRPTVVPQSLRLPS